MVIKWFRIVNKNQRSISFTKNLNIGDEVYQDVNKFNSDENDAS